MFTHCTKSPFDLARGSALQMLFGDSSATTVVKCGGNSCREVGTQKCAKFDSTKKIVIRLGVLHAQLRINNTRKLMPFSGIRLREWQKQFHRNHLTRIKAVDGACRLKY